MNVRRKMPKLVYTGRGKNHCRGGGRKGRGRRSEKEATKTNGRNPLPVGKARWERKEGSPNRKKEERKRKVAGSLSNREEGLKDRRRSA